MAVWPPPEVVEAVASTVAALRAAHGREAEALRWTDPHRWHVTLRFLGHTGLDEAAPAFRAAAAQPGFGTTEAALGPATGRFGRRLLHVPVAGLDGLAAAVVAVTAGVGEPPGERGFSGHLTLARAQDRRGADLTPFAHVPLVGRWPVTEVTLVSSRPGRGGAGYEVVEALPLQPGPEDPCPNTRSQLH